MTENKLQCGAVDSLAPRSNDRAYSSAHAATNDDPAIRRSTWRNPRYGFRVALVGMVWMVPGVLVGLLAALVVPVPFNFVTAGILGAVLGGAIGGGMESLDYTGAC